MTDHRGLLTEARETAKEQARAYRGQAERPLGGYVVVLVTYGVLVGSAALIAVLSGRRLPPRVSWNDLAITALGTHKLSRTISKDAVTSPLRAPFTRYEDTGGPAEVMEDIRKPSGLRHSVGELLSCPFCLDMWVVTAFTVGLVFAPRVTRFVAGTFTALTAADFLQLAYARAQRLAQG